MIALATLVVWFVAILAASFLAGAWMREEHDNAQEEIADVK